MAVLPGQAEYQASLMGGAPAPGALAAPASPVKKEPKVVKRTKGKKKKKGKRPAPAHAMYPGNGEGETVF